MENIRKFEEYSYHEKPMTVKELKERLEYVLGHGVSEDDYVFFNQVGEDEGSPDSLVPVITISTPAAKFFDEEKDILDTVVNREGVHLCFVSPTTRGVK